MRNAQISALWDELHTRQPWTNALSGDAPINLATETPVNASRKLLVIGINTVSIFPRYLIDRIGARLRCVQEAFSSCTMSCSSGLVAMACTRWACQLLVREYRLLASMQHVEDIRDLNESAAGTVFVRAPGIGLPFACLRRASMKGIPPTWWPCIRLIGE